MNPTLLKDLILAGHRVACKTFDGQWLVFLFIDGYGYFQGTEIQHSISASLSRGICDNKYDTKRLKNLFTGEYKIVTPLPQLPQVGDTVEVLEICRELPLFDEWRDDMKDMVGKKFVVGVVGGYGSILINSFVFSSRMVAKCEPEKEQSVQSEEQFGDEIIVNGVKYIKAI